MGKRILFFLACAFMTASMALAQRQVTGTVVDSETGEPIPGASVKVQGTTVGTLTNTDGRFTLGNVPSGSKTIIVSFMGMKTAEVAIRQNLNVIYLIPDVKAMDEVMVVAYGTATKENFTGAASVLSAETIEDRQISNVSNALAGNVAGVTATKSTGQPGTGSTIRIRGFGSINASMDPLYVVDGIEYHGDISAINPSDIESLSVQKDAAATALYGAKAANGVIMITTKKGKRGDGKITLDASWGSNSRQTRGYDVIKNTNQYMEQLYRSHYNNARFLLGQSTAGAAAYANTQAANATGYKIYTVPTGENLFTAQGLINPNAQLGYTDGQYFYTPDDWAKESFTHGLRQEYNVSASGATDKINYYFSAGYLGDDGVIVGSAFDRISTRLNVDYQVKKWLKVKSNIAYSNSTSNYPDLQTESGSSGNTFYIANYLAPVYPMYARNPDGTLMRNGSKPVYDYGDGTTGNYTRNVLSIANPIGDLTYQTEDYLMDILNGRWGVDITPVAGLTLSANLGMNLDNTRFHFASSNAYGQSASYGGEAEQVHQRQIELTQQYLANYSHRFGDAHNTAILLGYETYDYKYEESTAYGQNLYKSNSWAVNNSIDQRRGYGTEASWATRSYFGRLNYDYDEKYFAMLSLRRDGSSRFHKDNRWGTFWSASAAWNMNRENFLADQKWIDLLKLRASFGQTGNHSLGNNYAYVDQFTLTGSDGVFSDGTLYYKGNKDLTWEKTNSFDVAVDFEFWNGKLSGSIDYYNRTTKDMLYYKPVAYSNGFSSIPMNIGSMRNHGIEIDLQSKVFDTKNFTWNINWNLTRNWNKIIKLAPELEGELIDGSRIYTEGKSMYAYYLTKYAGVDPATGLALYWAKDEHGLEYATTDWSTARNTNRVSTGNMQPTFTGGLGTDLKFYGFDFAVQTSYQFGGKLYDNAYASFMNNLSSSYAGEAIHKDILKAWTPENTNTDVPRLCAGDQYTNSLSNRFLISSNYFAINNITLGYTLPVSLTQRIGIDAIRVFGAMDNVAVFSARKGMDPRLGILTSDAYHYSALRSASMGVKVTF